MNRNNYTYHELFRAAREMLRPVDGDNADFTAQQIVAKAAGRTVSQLVADYTLNVFSSDIDRVNDLVRRHYRGEPLAYILGQWEFHGLPLTVTPDVLIPRDDTEAVCGLAVKETKLLGVSGPRVLDLCAGSGCIGLAVAREVADARVTLGEISPAAIRVAKKNILDNKLSGRVTCFQLDVRQRPPAYLGRYDVIVSNPPYIPSAEIQWLMRDVKDFEPITALDGGDDGMKFYGEILSSNVKRGGYIILEIGNFFQIMEIETFKGFQIVGRVLDTGNFPRCIILRRL